MLIAPRARHLLAHPRGDLRALAVVLTGKGTDVRSGIRAIAHCGGTVFAQDHATSAHYGMPGAAIDTKLVHEVLALTDIAPAILTHVREHLPRP